MGGREGVEIWQLNAAADFFLLLAELSARWSFEPPCGWRPRKLWPGPPPCQRTGARFGEMRVTKRLASGCLDVAGRGGADPAKNAAQGAPPGPLFRARILGSESGPKMCTRTVEAHILVSGFGPGIWARFRGRLRRPFLAKGVFGLLDLLFEVPLRSPPAASLAAAAMRRRRGWAFGRASGLPSQGPQSGAVVGPAGGNFVAEADVLCVRHSESFRGLPVEVRGRVSPPACSSQPFCPSVRPGHPGSARGFRFRLLSLLGQS